MSYLIERMMGHYHVLMAVLPVWNLHPFAYLQVHGITDDEIREFFEIEEEEGE